jgi:hypothetical protein
MPGERAFPDRERDISTNPYGGKSSNQIRFGVGQELLLA